MLAPPLLTSGLPTPPGHGGACRGLAGGSIGPVTWVRKWKRVHACVLMAALMVVPQPSAAKWLPQVRFSGMLRAAHGASLRDEGDATYHHSWTGQLAAASYLWQPWFATWRTGFSATKMLSQSKVNSDGNVLTGDVALNVFPQSRFPFEAGFSVMDSRVSFDGAASGNSGTRMYRYFLNERYQPPSRKGTYALKLERTVQEDLDDGGIDSSNRIRAYASHKSGAHNLFANFGFENSHRQESDTEDRQWALTGRHAYRPNVEFSLENLATVSSSETVGGAGQTNPTLLLASSFAQWRDEDRPLTLNGAVTLNSNFDPEGNGDSHFVDLSTTGGYELTETLRLAMGVSGGVRRQVDDELTHTESQQGSIAYTSKGIDFFGWNYGRFANATVRNEVGSDQPDRQSLNATVGHNIGDQLTLGEIPTTIGFDFGQSFDGFDSTRESQRGSLSHRASFNLVRASGKSTATARATFRDNREFGDSVGANQSIGLGASLKRKLNRYSDWGIDTAFTNTRAVSDDSDGSSSTRYTIDARYRHTRVFGLSGLRFDSLVRMAFDSPVQVSFGSDSDDRWSWESNLRYGVGLLDVWFKASFYNPGANGTESFSLSLTRRF